MAHTDVARPQTPMAALTHLHAALDRYLRYRRTLAELRDLPIDSRLDLDIDGGEMARVARRAVYEGERAPHRADA